ncbi:uncharacterized protein LOC135379178 [Ornithodoros turicata]|uniref:uncharacterized protein LOC135376751 n=1 Tax=Ornithodoros turicata TaxID=34597 RepID=UPI003139AB3A
MTTAGQLKEFNPASASFEVYVERFELYVAANSIPEDKKSQLFLTALGDEAYTTLRSILLDKAPKDAVYKDIVTQLKKHYAPKRSVVAERYQFQRRSQKENESIGDFIVALKSLAIPCNFGAFQKEALRDRFIAGVSSDSIRCRLLALDDNEATFDKVCQVAFSMEAAERQTREMHNVPGTTKDSEGGESVLWKDQRPSQRKDMASVMSSALNI